MAFKYKFSKSLPFNANELYQMVAFKIRNNQITIEDIKKEFDKLVNTPRKN